MSAQISITVNLSGAVSEADIEAAQEFVRSMTGGDPKVTRFTLDPHTVMVGANGPSHAR